MNKLPKKITVYHHYGESVTEHDDLDYSRIDDAIAAIKAGDQIIEINCQCCQGMSLHDRKGEPGYCGECGGRCYVDVPAWTHGPMEGKLDYWQARALVAEAELKRRKP